MTDLLRSQQSHPHGDPATLARAQHECLVDTKSVENLQVHLRRVPVGPVLAAGAGLAVAQQLDGQQVHGVGELLVGILLLVQLRRGREGVDQHESGLVGVVGVRHLVGGVDAAQVRNTDDLGVRHGGCFFAEQIRE